MTSGDQESGSPADREEVESLFSVFPEPVVRYVIESDEPVVRAVNPAFENAFGVDSGSVTGRALTETVSTTSPVTADTARRLATKAVAGNPTAVRVAEGSTEALVRVLPAGLGGYVVFEDPVRDGYEALERRNERLEEFASVLSHDLRNPLEVAMLRLEAARDTGEDVHFEKVAAAHDRIERMIDQLLLLARQGDVITDPERVDLRSVVEHAWGMVEHSGSSLVTADGLPTVEADPDRLQSLLENLFRNAVEHGNGAVTVTVGPLSTGTGFYVADDGVGIPPEDRQRVFEPGYSTQSGGTGLGLAIVERIAEAHGWDVTLTASEAGGARFEFAATGPE